MFKNIQSLYVYIYIYTYSHTCIHICIISRSGPSEKAETCSGGHAEKIVYNVSIFMYIWSCLFGSYFSLIIYIYIHIYKCIYFWLQLFLFLYTHIYIYIYSYLDLYMYMQGFLNINPFNLTVLS